MSRAGEYSGGVVWCGVVWCGVVWCGVVWCGVIIVDSNMHKKTLKQVQFFSVNVEMQRYWFNVLYFLTMMDGLRKH